MLERKLERADWWLLSVGLRSRAVGAVLLLWEEEGDGEEKKEERVIRRIGWLSRIPHGVNLDWSSMGIIRHSTKISGCTGTRQRDMRESA